MTLWDQNELLIVIMHLGMCMVHVRTLLQGFFTKPSRSGFSPCDKLMMGVLSQTGVGWALTLFTDGAFDDM